MQTKQDATSKTCPRMRYPVEPPGVPGCQEAANRQAVQGLQNDLRVQMGGKQVNSKQDLSRERVSYLWQAAKAREAGNHRAASHYTVKARKIALLQGYQATYNRVTIVQQVSV